MEEPPTESVMSPYVHAQGQSCTSFLTFEYNIVDIFLSRSQCLLVWFSHPKRVRGGGNMGRLMMLFATRKKPLKLTTPAVLLFPLCAQAGIQRGHCDPGSCSVALRVFDKLSPTLSVQSVSLSNTPSEALLSNATPRLQPFPPYLAGVSLFRLGTSPLHKPTEVLSSPSHCSRTPDWSCAARFPFHPGFGSVCWGIPPNSKSEKWCWCNFSALWGQGIVPWVLVLCMQIQCCSLTQH